MLHQVVVSTAVLSIERREYYWTVVALERDC